MGFVDQGPPTGGAQGQGRNGTGTAYEQRGTGGGSSAGRTAGGHVWTLPRCVPGHRRENHPQGCIRREGASEAAPEAVGQAVGGG